MRSFCIKALSAIALALVIGSCGSTRRIITVQKTAPEVILSLPKELDYSPTAKIDVNLEDKIKENTIIKDINGNDMILMTAVQDSTTGEMVASEELESALIVSRFRNIAERAGIVDLKFNVFVPKELTGTDYQLILTPEMRMLDDTTKLEPIVFTGANFLEEQNRGYTAYENFMKRQLEHTEKLPIVDTMELIRSRLFSKFIQRNLPEVYKFRNGVLDKSVAEELMQSQYGVTVREAINHYLDPAKVRKINVENDRYKQLVKTEAIRNAKIDSLIETPTGLDDILYTYTVSLKPAAKVKKIEMGLKGKIINNENQRLYTIPRIEPVQYYISSISAFSDTSEHYISVIVYRKAMANMSSNILFDVGKYNVNPELPGNDKEISVIKQNLRYLIENETFDLDSIVVSATCSPEGLVASNTTLSKNRAESVVKYFDSYVTNVVDSLNSESDFAVDEEGNLVVTKKARRVRFRSKAEPENWKYLGELVNKDEVLTEEEKAEYHSIADKYSNLDERERVLAGKPYYKYIRSELYPKTRLVYFDFYMHRKGMIEEKMVTTEIDTLYMRGLEYLKDRDYEEALKILDKYQDFNTAIAYCALDRNYSALAILENMEKTAQVNYMLALIHSRLGEEVKAVECYVHSCQQDQSFIYRGNLDPEISVLIKKYNLNHFDE
ncbi:MAG: hypothetical protein KBT00_01890 [Bacteroidales bacterium]|nr:hypothetical protein [Candidatus Cacconaster merdequi]